MRKLCNILAVLWLAASPTYAADIGASSWSETDASNTSTPPAGWPPGMNPAQVHPTGRAMMGAIKRFYDHMQPTITSSGSANVQTLSYGVAPTAYVTGDVYSFIAGYTNSGATTLNINSLGAKDVQINGGALTGGEIVSSRVVTVYYDGTRFQILYGMPALTGDVTNTIGLLATTIAANVVTNAKLATMANSTIKCRNTAGTGNAEDCTVAQVTALLNAMVGDSGAGGTKGMVPAPAAGDAAANKFLKASGAWVAIPTTADAFARGASIILMGGGL